MNVWRTPPPKKSAFYHFWVPIYSLFSAKYAVIQLICSFVKKWSNKNSPNFFEIDHYLPTSRPVARARRARISNFYVSNFYVSQEEGQLAVKTITDVFLPKKSIPGAKNSLKCETSLFSANLLFVEFLKNKKWLKQESFTF
jgi:hypothetical protein